MPLRHSFKVVVKELQAKRLALLINYNKKPTKEIEEQIKAIEDRIRVFEDRIQTGNDPGVRIV